MSTLPLGRCLAPILSMPLYSLPFSSLLCNSFSIFFKFPLLLLIPSLSLLSSFVFIIISPFSSVSSFDWLLNGTLLRHPWCRLALRFLASSPHIRGARDWGPFLWIKIIMIYLGLLTYYLIILNKSLLYKLKLLSY